VSRFESAGNCNQKGDGFISETGRQGQNETADAGKYESPDSQNQLPPAIGAIAPDAEKMAPETVSIAPAIAPLSQAGDDRKSEDIELKEFNQLPQLPPAIAPIAPLAGAIAPISCPDDITSDDWMPDAATADQATTDRSDLWRLEKNGNRWRWRLRFIASKPSQNFTGETNELSELISTRPGKGRHGHIRSESETLKREAQYIADSLPAGNRSRADRPESSGKRTPADRASKRGCVPASGLSGVESGGELPTASSELRM